MSFHAFWGINDDTPASRPIRLPPYQSLSFKPRHAYDIIMPPTSTDEKWHVDYRTAIGWYCTASFVQCDSNPGGEGRREVGSGRLRHEGNVETGAATCYRRYQHQPGLYSVQVYCAMERVREVPRSCMMHLLARTPCLYVGGNYSTRLGTRCALKIL